MKRKNGVNVRKFKKEGGKKGNTSQQDWMREAMGEESGEVFAITAWRLPPAQSARLALRQLSLPGWPSAPLAPFAYLPIIASCEHMLYNSRSCF
ncbi:hypothetical protein NC653_022698 [Populus alba x Populus x berolinensis]|uniref:Uncharacterized protein n=1 Tax=Populus alba x Populus x berolinensis TaxID=444605 RepID=A0AAD6QA28_9ROSI|nr:hypothetical protein NC653_022698 [Populus alba x Populus x berolinensis]